MAGNDAYATALGRAKEIVSKYSMSDEYPASNGGVAGMKRPAQDENSSATTEKRPLVMDKLAAACEAAARLNEKLGSQALPNSPMNPNPNSNQNPNPGQQNPWEVTTETTIPDRYVGLVIGKKGEQITSLQTDSGCKVQISQAGTPERVVTLRGTKQQIDHAKRLISEIIERADKNGPVAPSIYASGNITTIEMSIPGLKAGLIIGKNGETIKSLQEDHGVKMVLIQQTNSPSPEDKPLRITGDPARVEKARQTILNLLNTRDRGGGGMYGYDGQETSQFAVPSDKAGLVIGKGGESIKEICRVSGAHVEISKDPSPDPTIKLFNVRGSRQEIEQATRMISERAGISMTRPVSTGASGAWGQYGYPQTDPWGMGAAGGQAAASSAGMPPPTLNPYTGQPDYSAAWAEYYRRQGMHDYADAILRQAQQSQTGAMQPTAQVPSANMAQPAAPVAAPVPVQGQAQAPAQYDFNQWQQWQQWQAWQQAWQQQGGAPNQPGAGGCAPPQQMPGAPGQAHPMPQQ